MVDDTLYAIDASNWGHAAYHGGDELLETLDMMILGFFKRIRESRGVDPRFVVAAIDDHTAPSFRKDLHQEFKGNREHNPELSEALLKMPEVFSRRGIRCISHRKHEADDVLATLAKRADFHTVLLLSSDRDLWQCLTPNVYQGHRSKGVRHFHSDETLYDEHGVTPAQWPSVLALAGKPSNGIPGLDGIGLKGACRLVAQFGGLDGVLTGYKGVERQSYRSALEKPGNADKARLYLKLSTLVDDLCIDTSEEAMARSTR